MRSHFTLSQSVIDLSIWKQFRFQVSPDLLAALKIGSNQLVENMRLLTAIAYFQDKKLSLGKAAELAGVNRLEFMDILAKKGIVIFDYDESELDTELSGIGQL